MNSASALPPQAIFQNDSTPDLEPWLDWPTPLSKKQLLDGICSDFEHDCVDAMTTLSRLHKHGFLATPKELAAVFVAGFRALSSEAA